MNNLLKIIDFMYNRIDNDMIYVNKDELKTPLSYSNMLVRDFLKAKIFVIDHRHTKLLSLTDIEPQLTQLPFPHMFVDANIIHKKYQIFGVEIMSIEPEIHFNNEKDIFISAFYENLESGWLGLFGFTVLHNKPCGLTGDNPRRLIVDNSENLKLKPINHQDMTQQERIHERLQQSLITQKICQKKIASFVMNFLLFLNEPDVYYFNVERTLEQNQKRIKRGKLPIPKYSIIKVTGQLKKYIDKLESINAFSYSHKFWVRGHWRNFQSHIYKNKKGKRTWIKPYIKGQGVLVDKIYKLKQS